MKNCFDLSGRKFGKWKVLCFDSKRNRVFYWLCECECGTKRTVRSTSLRSGESKSCGCKKNRVEILGDIAKIYFNGKHSDKFAIIDIDMLLLVSDYTWRYTKEGYARAHMPNMRDKDVCIFMHRLLLPSKDLVDHKDGCGLNNRMCNLREASPRNNMMNRRKLIDGKTSKYKGVSWDSSRSKWGVQISIPRSEGKGLRKNLGRFADEDDAAKAYDRAAIKYYGEFAATNKMLGLIDY